ncbi:MAG: ribulose-phosphate 3-epimerase [Nitrospinota bacterium]
MVKVAPSILSADFSKLGKEIEAVEKAGADAIHIDIMDGAFVPNISIGPFIVETVNKCTKLPLDVHLMIENPDRYINDFIKAGADWLTVHIETCPHIQRTLTLIREAKARPGVVINPGTPVHMAESIIEDIDLLLIMSVNPGFGGQKFLPSVLKKVEIAKGLVLQSGCDVEIEVDGGITADNASSLKSAGADILVAGSSVYKSKDYTKAITKLKGL